MTTTQPTLPTTTEVLLDALRGTQQAADLVAMLAHHLGRNDNRLDGVRAAQAEAVTAARRAGMAETSVAVVRVSVAVLAADLLGAL